MYPNECAQEVRVLCDSRLRCKTWDGLRSPADAVQQLLNTTDGMRIFTGQS